MVIELHSAAQAAEFVSELDHGVGTGAVYETVRPIVEPLAEDRPSHDGIDALATLVADGWLDAALFDAVDDVE